MNETSLQEMELVNEFAKVKLTIDRSGNCPRLRITSVPLGKSIVLDALELESLTWQDFQTFSKFLATPFGPD